MSSLQLIVHSCVFFRITKLEICLSSSFIETLKIRGPNFMNLSLVSNPPKNGFQLCADLNLETLNTILSETNHF